MLWNVNTSLSSLEKLKLINNFRPNKSHTAKDVVYQIWQNLLRLCLRYLTCGLHGKEAKVTLVILEQIIAYLVKILNLAIFFNDEFRCYHDILWENATCQKVLYGNLYGSSFLTNVLSTRVVPMQQTCWVHVTGQEVHLQIPRKTHKKNFCCWIWIYIFFNLFIHRSFLFSFQFHFILFSLQ